MNVNLLDPANWINPKTKQRYMYFDRQGRGYDDVLDWARAFEPPKKGSAKARALWFLKTRVVRQERVCFGLFWVSTVWLGLDHAYAGRPLIFESMVFCRFPFPKVKKVASYWFGFLKRKYSRRKQTDQDRLFASVMDNPFMRPKLFAGCSDLDAARYTTERQAIAGHRILVARWNKPGKIWDHLWNHDEATEWQTGYLRLRAFLRRENRVPIKLWWFLAWTAYILLQGILVGVLWGVYYAK